MRSDVERLASTTGDLAGAVTRHDAAISAAASRLSDAEAAAAAAQRSVDALSAQVERLSSSAASGAGVAEGRRLARIGGLGWDTAAAELESRAIALLTAAGVERQAYGPVAAAVGRNGTGSAAETVFRTPAALDEARIAVRALKREYAPRTTAWLDVARTRAENAPVRTMHRIADMLVEIERARPDRLPVRREAGSRSVTVGETRVAHVSADKVMWTPAGVSRYAASDRADAEAVAMAA